MVVQLLALASFAQDRAVYTESLAAGWQDWSWGSVRDFTAQPAHAGADALGTSAGVWGALSLYTPTPFGDRAALSFWFRGTGSAVSLTVEATGQGYSAPSILVDDLAVTSPNAYTQVIVDLDALGNHPWDRLTWQDASGFGTSFLLDDVALLQDLPASTTFTGADPIGTSTIVVHGGGDAANVTVSVNNVAVAVTSRQVLADPARAVLTLASPLVPGPLVVTTGDGVFRSTIGTASVVVPLAPTHAISPWIYGVAFPPAGWVDVHGATVARWGGNAVTAYNPTLDVTNAGMDWYFENRSSDDAGAWIDGLRTSGVSTFLTVPSLDWVAKDATSYSYSVARYGAQESVDPWNADAGNGVRANGSPILTNDPRDAYTGWSPAQAESWLSGLAHAPVFAAIDNELDITSDTHQDIHPAPLGYDELLTRYIDFAGAVKGARPDALVTAPASCCWWFYWNSMVGDPDKVAHGGMDFVPWFLEEVAAADAAAGARTLDVLDVHYYPDGIYNDVVDAATRARRLRSTRSLWDPTYTDEGWIGVDQWATQTQPGRNQVQLVPRLKDLVAAHYPGTMTGIGEWNFGAEGDLSGGLAVADALGIFGREDLDVATYWTTPDAGTPAAAAFWLFRAPGRPFGDEALPVYAANPDLLGVYAALDEADRPTVVLVNKDPTNAVRVQVGNLPNGTYTVRHFGGAGDAELLEETLVVSGQQVVVPAYGAVFLGLDASPWPLGLEVAPIVLGRTVPVRVTGANPGETVRLFAGAREGSGPCSQPLGACLDLAGGVQVVASAVADATGTATFAPLAPANLGFRTVALQAGVARGGAGLTSHPVTRTTIP